MTQPGRRPSSRARKTGSPAAPPGTEADAITRAKDALRAQIRAERSRSPVTQADQDARLRHALDVSAGRARVALYASIDPEPDTWPLIDALHARGVRVLLPVLAGRRTPAWSWFTGRAHLRPGWHGIPEPTGDVLGPEALGEADLVWCSALAVGADGHRVGTGGGWYDRALAHRRPDAPLAALVNEREVLDAVPAHPWDRPVDVVVTERGARWTAE
ncbi:5-formyltetrahydrofolate cyclo-ligase [Nigerium massiliense]|uniref:5-formyltetrahydrofolate cyclo-ligase n=1 Tax=Nigerium massiliense TaxID=1522317 RepID=UPI0006949819|nr:5-formyltetrahydrofolate cyclo-ligase [Nigerium massiliense]